MEISDLESDLSLEEIAIEIIYALSMGRDGNGGHDRRRVYGLRPVTAKIWAMRGRGGAAAGSYRCDCAGSRRKGCTSRMALSRKQSECLAGFYLIEGRGPETMPSKLRRANSPLVWAVLKYGRSERINEHQWGTKAVVAIPSGGA